MAGKTSNPEILFVVVEKFQISLWPSNKLLVYNGGLPKTGRNDPIATAFGNMVEHTT